MPCRVAAADGKVLKPFVGLVIFLMKRWSCSMMFVQILDLQDLNERPEPQEPQ